SSAQSAVLKRARSVASGSATHVGLGVQPAHSHQIDLTPPRAVAFTDPAVQRNLLIGIVIVVLIERARMRPGGERLTPHSEKEKVLKASRKREAFFILEGGGPWRQRWNEREV